MFTVIERVLGLAQVPGPNIRQAGCGEGTQSRFPDQFEKVEARWSVLQTSSSDSECDESPPVSPLKAPGAEASAMDAVDSKGPAE